MPTVSQGEVGCEKTMGSEPSLLYGGIIPDDGLFRMYTAQDDYNLC
jgi:hypothetical protein